jgi:DNA repair exonuclease SbcCD ATPase subunit
VLSALDSLEARLATVSRSLDHERGQRDSVRASLEREEAAASAAKQKAELASKASEVVQAALEARRKALKDRVEDLVTRGLRAIFGRADLELVFQTTVRGGTVGIKPVLRSKFRGKELEASIVDGHGGGIADAVSFLLRVVVLSLARPRLAPFLALDEPFRHVAREHLPGCAALLRELNRSAGIQFLIVTHEADLLDAADVVYRTSVKDGQTTFVLEHDLDDGAFHRGGKK